MGIRKDQEYLTAVLVRHYNKKTNYGYYVTIHYIYENYLFGITNASWTPYIWSR